MLYQLWYNRKTFNKVKVVLKTFPRFGIVLLLYLFMVLFFAGFGPFLYRLQNTTTDDDYFNSYSDSGLFDHIYIYIY